MNAARDGSDTNQTSLTSQNQDMVLVCPEYVQWVRDADQTLVVNSRRGTLYRLRGTGAAVWDWLTLGYSYARLVALLAALLGDAPEEGEATLVRLLTEWLENGLLEEESAAAVYG